jgi:hypothetical protein
MNATNDIQNQETRVDTNAQEEVQAAEAQPQNGGSPEVKNADKAGRVRQAATVAGGAVAGAAGAGVIMGFVVPDDAPEQVSPTGSHSSFTAGPLPSAADFDGSEITEASHVNDDMSFAEAFASARQETGPGGVFFWRGGVYGTYYRDEWSQLSPEYREVFSNYPYHQPENTAAGIAADAAVTDADTAEADDTGSVDTAGEVEILDVQYADADGLTATGDPISGDGDYPLPADTDGVIDYSLPDGETPEPDVLDLSEPQLMNENADGMQQTQPQEGDPGDTYLVDNNLPDYTNDASVEQFINV